MEESKRGIFGFIVVIIVIGLVAIFVVSQLDDSSEEGTRVPVEERTPAQELAIFAAGEYVPEDDSRVEKFDELLTSLSANTSAERREIADLSTEAVLTLREENDVEVNLQDFMKRAKELAGETDPETSYEEVISKLKIILTEEGSEA